MKLFNKSTISLALTAAMMGGVAMTQQANAAAQLAPGADHVSVNGLGQALIFPYYTTRGGFKSFFNVTNTSDKTVPVKVRFREGLNSRDALDFVVVLSPWDVWTGWVEQGATGPVVKSNDNSCTVGAPDIKGAGQPLSAVGYNFPAWADQGDQTVDRTREGYVEIIAMGRATSELTPLAVNAKHLTSGVNKGVPFNCAGINTAFKAPAGQLALPVPAIFPDAVRGVLGDGDAPAIDDVQGFAAMGENPLKGNFSLIAAGKGIGAGNSAIALADFMDVGTAPGTGLVTAQNFPYFLEPTLASGQGLWTTAGLADVDTALATQSIANEWANNASTGAETAWIVNFPTKSFYVDDRTSLGVVTTTNIQAAANQWRAGSNALAAAGTGAGFTGTFGPSTANGANVDLGMFNFDREEQFKQADPGATQPSPAPVDPTLTVSLQRETNVIVNAAPDSDLGLSPKVFLPSPASTDLAPAKNGWTALSFVTGTFPSVGYAYKIRNQGDKTLAFGQIVDHSYGDLTLPVTP